MMDNAALFSPWAALSGPRRNGSLRLAKHEAGQKPLASPGVCFLTPEGVRYVDAECSQGVEILAAPPQGERQALPLTRESS